MVHLVKINAQPTLIRAAEFPKNVLNIHTPAFYARTHTHNIFACDTYAFVQLFAMYGYFWMQEHLLNSECNCSSVNKSPMSCGQAAGSTGHRRTRTMVPWCAYIWQVDCFYGVCASGCVCVLIKWSVGQAALFVIGTGVGLNHLINNQLRLLNNCRFVVVAVKSIKFMQRSLCFPAMQFLMVELCVLLKNFTGL